MESTFHLPSEDTRIYLPPGYYGTVRYVGPVDGTQGTWLGVEWDDSGRGKHDGVKDGKRYFICRFSNAGSFIRPSSSISYGCSFLRALTMKYVEVAHGSASQEKVILGSSNGTIQVEAVGLDKIRSKFANLSRLREVSLDTENVSSADPQGDIAKTCPNVRGLDLSASLLPSWDMVALITSELHLLERLALNRTRFTPLRSQLNPTHFRRLAELQLNGTMMSWEAMTKVIAFMPNLRIVEMGYNSLSCLSSTAMHTGLEVINLDSNELSDWSHLSYALESFNSLRRLILTANQVKQVPPFDGQLSPLRRIRHMALSFNQIRECIAMDHLSRWCPQLETLNITGNPLAEDVNNRGQHTRQFVVAKIPSLLVLDSAAISARERTDCELFYLSYVANTALSKEERNKEHPRWEALCAKHGNPVDDVPRKPREDKLSNHLINIYVHPCADPPKADDGDEFMSPLILRVLSTMTLRTFHLKLIKSLKAPKGTKLYIWLKMSHNDFAPLNDNEEQDLAWWGIEEGSSIFVNIQ